MGLAAGEAEAGHQDRTALPEALRVAAVLGVQRAGRRNAELLPQLLLPLSHQGGRREDEGAADLAPDHVLLEDQAGLDRLPQADLIGEEHPPPEPLEDPQDGLHLVAHPLHPAHGGERQQPVVAVLGEHLGRAAGQLERLQVGRAGRGRAARGDRPPPARRRRERARSGVAPQRRRAAGRGEILSRTSVDPAPGTAPGGRRPGGRPRRGRDGVGRRSPGGAPPRARAAGKALEESSPPRQVFSQLRAARSTSLGGAPLPSRHSRRSSQLRRDPGSILPFERMACTAPSKVGGSSSASRSSARPARFAHFPRQNLRKAERNAARAAGEREPDSPPGRA